MQASLNIVVRKVLFLPVILALAVGITVFTSLFAPGGRLAEYSIGVRLAVNGFNLLLYYAASYWFLGSFLAWGLQRYVPWIAIQFAFYLPLAVITGLIDSYIARGGFVMSDAVWSMVTSAAMVTIAILLAVLILRPRLEAVLRTLGRPGNLFWPHRPPPRTLVDDLPAEVRGPVRKVQSANQYVDVTTDNGAATLRMPLKDAIDALPQEDGMRISRSVWLAFNHIASVEQSGGRLTITDGSGELFNVGGTYADNVLERLEKRGVWSPP
ncbi:LytTR family DNA-binding domain-containing protein [Yoonia sp. 208BN28-4]|uniref:LytTR family DNA-binding domain-containing protein n=1 Tax=Yoonia sp. 208BN28-4 TaxID=3126505 RepID=UPI0030AF883B